MSLSPNRIFGLQLTPASLSSSDRSYPTIRLPTLAASREDTSSILWTVIEMLHHFKEARITEPFSVHRLSGRPPQTTRLSVPSVPSSLKETSKELLTFSGSTAIESRLNYIIMRNLVTLRFLTLPGVDSTLSYDATLMKSRVGQIT